MLTKNINKTHFLFKRSLKLFLAFWVFFFLSFLPVNADEIETQKEQLRNKLTEIQKEISDIENKIAETKKQQRTLASETHILEHEIERQILEQKALNLAIKELEESIDFKNLEIDDLNKELTKKKELLREAIKELESYEKISWFDMLLKGGKISDIFGQMQNIYNLQKKVNVFIQNIDELRGNLEKEKLSLEEAKRENIRLKSLSRLQQVSLENKKREKNELLRKTKGSEREYRKLKRVKAKDVELIKQQLYRLESSGVSMSFEEAYQKAKFVGDKTGVRPAFILGLFQVESRLGANLGTGSWQKDLYQCYIDIGKRAKAEREKRAYLQITSSLGLNPDTMPVSKALRKVGCGGAMGPAQFMPTTWLGYQNQVASLIGRTPNPWRIEDAFMASSIKLANDGANARTIKAEKRAAAKYYAGSRWRRYPGQNYARQVLSWAEYYQEQIDAMIKGS